MFRIIKKIHFSADENRMNSIADTKIARKMYYSRKSKNRIPPKKKVFMDE